MRNLVRFRTLTLLALLCFIPALMPATTPAQIAVGIGITVHTAPPPIPVEVVQPPCPEEGYLWTPGYWAYGPAGYYWVDGVWVAPPRVGLLWTPGYWGFAGGVYGWHAGYWGPHVGFYGGINYGFGYGGVGFVGGAWRGGVFAYNTAVWHAGPGFHNVYVDRTVVHERVVNHYSFNGEGGVRAMPTAEERGYEHEQHFRATHEQSSHENFARNDPNARFANNHGRPVGMGVNARQERQQDRIAQGVHSGQMTPHETAHVEHQEAAIHHEVHNDREANGGHLTAQEHRQVEHQQNHESKEIYRDKHNDRKEK